MDDNQQIFPLSSSEIDAARKLVEKYSNPNISLGKSEINELLGYLNKLSNFKNETKLDFLNNPENIARINEDFSTAFEATLPSNRAEQEALRQAREEETKKSEIKAQEEVEQVIRQSQRIADLKQQEQSQQTAQEHKLETIAEGEHVFLQPNDTTALAENLLEPTQKAKNLKKNNPANKNEFIENHKKDLPQETRDNQETEAALGNIWEAVNNDQLASLALASLGNPNSKALQQTTSPSRREEIAREIKKNIEATRAVSIPLFGKDTTEYLLPSVERAIRSGGFNATSEPSLAYPLVDPESLKNLPTQEGNSTQGIVHQLSTKPPDKLGVLGLGGTPRSALLSAARDHAKKGEKDQALAAHAAAYGVTPANLHVLSTLLLQEGISLSIARQKELKRILLQHSQHQGLTSPLTLGLILRNKGFYVEQLAPVLTGKSSGGFQPSQHGIKGFFGGAINLALGRGKSAVSKRLLKKASKKLAKKGAKTVAKYAAVETVEAIVGGPIGVALAVLTTIYAVTKITISKIFDFVLGDDKGLAPFLLFGGLIGAGLFIGGPVGAVVAAPGVGGIGLSIAQGGSAVFALGETIMGITGSFATVFTNTMIITIISIPLVIAFILFIINSGALIVPPRSGFGGQSKLNPGIDHVGSCPIPGGANISNPSYNPLAESQGLGFSFSGHGSNPYPWGTEACSYGIPIRGMYKVTDNIGCKGPTSDIPNYNPNNLCVDVDESAKCPFFGFAADFPAPGGTPVVLPTICDDPSQCEPIEWQMASAFQNCGATSADINDPRCKDFRGFGAIFTGEGNGHKWKIYLNHIGNLQSESGTTYLSDTQVAEVFDNHLHIELNRDGEPIRPDFLCGG